MDLTPPLPNTDWARLQPSDGTGKNQKTEIGSTDAPFL